MTIQRSSFTETVPGGEVEFTNEPHPMSGLPSVYADALSFILTDGDSHIPMMNHFSNLEEPRVGISAGKPILPEDVKNNMWARKRILMNATALAVHSIIAPRTREVIETLNQLPNSSHPLNPDTIFVGSD